MKRADKNIFNSIQMPQLRKNTFDLSHDVKLSFNMGELVPTCWIETLPGDEFTISVENMLRMAPMINPVMHEINVTTHFWYVRNSLLWPNFEDFITGRSTPAWPYIEPDSTGSGSTWDYDIGCLGDYLGIPTEVRGTDFNMSAMPVAAYALIYDEFYRSDQIQTVESFQELSDGNNPWAKTQATGALKKRAWEHDYFTACLPNPQAGSSSVSLPLLLEDTVPVDTVGGLGSGQVGKFKKGSDDTNVGLGSVSTVSGGDVNVGSDAVYYDPNGTLEVNINSTANTITTLRRAMKLQEFLERDSRGGLRYSENILAHFGEMTSDSRLFRPEYIGGTKQRMVISEVLSTAQTYDASGDVPVGALAGHGISVGGGNTFKYEAKDHGIIMGIISVLPRTAYFQGLHRKWRRFTREDHYWPSFANIGEQAVPKLELLLDRTQHTSTSHEATLGFVPRYSDYKYEPSRVHGDFRSTKDSWHLARKFDPSSMPALNGAFIECNPSDRIFAVQDGSHAIYAHIYNNIYARRKMPVFGNPSI
jgi:hypothetical protein